jgi:hypothetical protein
VEVFLRFSRSVRCIHNAWSAKCFKSKAVYLKDLLEQQEEGATLQTRPQAKIDILAHRMPILGAIAAKMNVRTKGKLPNVTDHIIAQTLYQMQMDAIKLKPEVFTEILATEYMRRKRAIEAASQAGFVKFRSSLSQLIELL